MTYSKQLCEGGAIGAAGDILKWHSGQLTMFSLPVQVLCDTRPGGEVCHNPGQRVEGI